MYDFPIDESTYELLHSDEQAAYNALDTYIDEELSLCQNDYMRLEKAICNCIEKLEALYYNEGIKKGISIARQKH